MPNGQKQQSMEKMARPKWSRGGSTMKLSSLSLSLELSLWNAADSDRTFRRLKKKLLIFQCILLGGKHHSRDAALILAVTPATCVRRTCRSHFHFEHLQSGVS